MTFKDSITLGNLLAGFAAVLSLFIIPDPWRAFQWSVAFIFIGYVCDVLDGPVARLLHQQTTFGGHLDGVCDYITNSIAPSFILFHFYWRLGGVHWAIAAVVGAFPLVFGTIRQAQQMDRPLSYPCYWIGLPRPVLTIFILALLNSSSFWFGIRSGSPWRELVFGGGALLVAVFSFLHLSKLPFVNRTKRRWMKWLHLGMHLFMTGSPIVLALGWLLLDWPGVVYDYLLFCLIIYIFISWAQSPKEDYRRLRRYIAGGPLVRPLVHVDSSWRARTWAVYFLEDGPSEQVEAVVLEDGLAGDGDDPAAATPGAPPLAPAPEASVVGEAPVHAGAAEGGGEEDHPEGGEDKALQRQSSHGA